MRPLQATTADSSYLHEGRAGPSRYLVLLPYQQQTARTYTRAEQDHRGTSCCYHINSRQLVPTRGPSRTIAVPRAVTISTADSSYLHEGRAGPSRYLVLSPDITKRSYSYCGAVIWCPTRIYIEKQCFK